MNGLTAVAYTDALVQLVRLGDGPEVVGYIFFVAELFRTTCSDVERDVESFANSRVEPSDAGSYVKCAH